MKKIKENIPKVKQVKEVESEPVVVKKKPKIETTEEIKNAMHTELYGEMTELKSPAEIEQMKEE